MSLAGVLLFVLLPLGAGAVIMSALIRGSANPDSTLTSEVAAARRHSVITSMLAGLASAIAAGGVLVTSMVADLNLPATLVGCVPLLGAGAALLVLLAGELTWPRQRGLTRTAVLHDRTPGTVMRGRWPTTAAVSLLLTAATVVAGGVLASPDGRSVSRSTATTSQSSSPFPGWHYGALQLACLVACLALAVLVALAAVRRPAVVTASLPTDLLLRRASAARACRALVGGTLLTLGPDLAVGGLAATHVLDSAGTTMLLARAAVGVGMLVGLSALVAVFVPVPRLRTPTSPADVAAVR